MPKVLPVTTELVRPPPSRLLVDGLSALFFKRILLNLLIVRVQVLRMSSHLYRGQRSACSPLLPSCPFQGWSSAPQAWQQAAAATEPSRWSALPALNYKRFENCTRWKPCNHQRLTSFDLHHLGVNCLDLSEQIPMVQWWKRGEGKKTERRGQPCTGDKSEG